MVALGVALLAAGTAPAVVVVGVALALVPAVTVAVSLVNRLVTQVLPVRVLPKMDFREGLPVDCRTMVVVSVLLAPEDEVSPLLSRLEIHWLASADANLHLALLVCLADAPEESMPGDVDLVRRLEEGVRALNARYGHGDRGPFHLLHRRRRWNAGEGCWMGWERKRGKLAEFNRLLAGDPETSFAGHVGDPDFLRTIRFVITLDADTELPRGAARRLVATLAHPLNRAELDAADGSRDGRLHDPPAAHRGDALRRRRLLVRPASSRETRASTSTPARRRTCTRTSSARASTSARGSTSRWRSRQSLRGRVPENARAQPRSVRGHPRAERRW